MNDEISNRQDLIDSRDVIARLEELTDEHNALKAEVSDAEEAVKDLHGDGMREETPGERDEAAHLAEVLTDARSALADWEEECGEELQTLQRLHDDAEGYSDWADGATLVRDSYFQDHAQTLAEDLYGKELRESQWPFDYIDWERAADALKMDYTCVDFDGVDYWVRS